MFEGGAQLLSQADDVFPREFSRRADLIERLALDVLHNEERRPLI